jgi:hypothetical protein
VVGEAAARVMRGSVALAGLLLGAAGAPPAAAADYAVRGGCRDGQPNGAYELSSPDGRLRVSGAFAKGRRTGTFIFWSARGARIAAVPFDDDAKSGTVALWYAPAGGGDDGRRKLEAPYRADVPHGERRSWHRNGNPRIVALYEQGRLAEARAWSPEGAPLPDADARAQAEGDLALDATLLAEFDRIVDDNRPPCGPRGS